MNEKHSSWCLYWTCRGLRFLHRKEVLLRLGGEGCIYCNMKIVYLPKPPFLQPTVEWTTADEQRLREKQKCKGPPPPPQDLVSKQEHFNQEIKTQYRLGP